VCARLPYRRQKHIRKAYTVCIYNRGSIRLKRLGLSAYHITANKIQIEPLAKDTAELRTNSILKSDLNVSILDPAIAIKAAKLRCKYAESPTADAIIAPTAIVMCCDYILTDDKHIKQIKETKT